EACCCKCSQPTKRGEIIPANPGKSLQAIASSNSGPVGIVFISHNLQQPFGTLQDDQSKQALRQPALQGLAGQRRAAYGQRLPVFARSRRYQASSTQATDHACAGQPRGACGGSSSKISLTWPRPPSRR